MRPEYMKQISFVGKCTVFMIYIDWKRYAIYLVIYAGLGNQNDQNQVV